MSLLGFCQWLEDTSVSSAIRESAWGFPIIESAHVLGLFLFGLAVLVDFRRMNWTFRLVPAQEFAVELRPWAVTGIVVMMVSGVLLFLNTPLEYYNDTFFRLKVIALLLIAANAWLVRLVSGRFFAKRALTMILWAGVVITGRLIGYHLLGAD